MSGVLLYANGRVAKELKELGLKAERGSADSYIGMFFDLDHVVVSAGAPKIMNYSFFVFLGSE